MKYWLRLTTRWDTPCLLIEAYSSNVSDNLSPWAQSVKSVLDKAGFSFIWLNPMQVAEDVNHFLKELEQRLTDQFLQQWKADQLGSRKLRSHRTFKSTFEQEPYLHLPRHLRIPLTRLRTSSHQLMIEIGRYHRPPIPVEDRLCPTCNVIEDEEHFMLECTQYNREALINWCTNNHKPFQHL